MTKEELSFIEKYIDGLCLSMAYNLESPSLNIPIKLNSLDMSALLDLMFMMYLEIDTVRMIWGNGGEAIGIMGGKQ